MDDHERGGCPPDDINLEFVGPTYRHGKIYSLIDAFATPDSARLVAEYVKARWDGIRESIAGASVDLQISDLVYPDLTPTITCREGIVVKFPEIECMIKQVGKARIRLILTACVPPHHSKIWARISYAGVNVLMKGKDLAEFFSVSEGLSKALARIVKEYYIAALEARRITTQLQKLHEIKIKTAISDLGEIGTMIPQKKFKLKDLTEKELETKKLSQYLKIGFGEDLADFTDLSNLSEDFKWIKVIRPPEINGICIGHKSKESSEFVFLMHMPTGDFAYSYDASRVGSSLMQVQTSMAV